MQLTVTNEQRFQIPAHSAAIGFSQSGYTLMYSAGDNNFTAWDEATSANETAFIVNIPKNAFFYLSGNTGDVVITY